MNKESNNIMNEGHKTTKSTAKKVSSKSKSSEEVVSDISGLNNKFLLVRVGTELHPASSQELTDIEEKLVDLFEKNNINCVAFVTHHAVEMQIIESIKKE